MNTLKAVLDTDGDGNCDEDDVRRKVTHLMSIVSCVQAVIIVVGILVIFGYHHMR